MDNEVSWTFSLCNSSDIVMMMISSKILNFFCIMQTFSWEILNITSAKTSLVKDNLSVYNLYTACVLAYLVFFKKAEYRTFQKNNIQDSGYLRYISYHNMLCMTTCKHINVFHLRYFGTRRVRISQVNVQSKIYNL